MYNEAFIKFFNLTRESFVGRQDLSWLDRRLEIRGKCFHTQNMRLAKNFGRKLAKNLVANLNQIKRKCIVASKKHYK